MEHQDSYEQARKRVDAKIGFAIHLVVYILVNSALIAINSSTSPGYHWFGWPLGGWGIGLFFHGMGVFVFTGKSSIRERMIEKEMKRGGER
jgi:hypothetical protein